MTLTEPTIEVEVLSGPAGHCLVLGNHRLAGPKPWGGGRVVHSWTVSVADVFAQLPYVDSTGLVADLLRQSHLTQTAWIASGGEGKGPLAKLLDGAAHHIAALKARAGKDTA